MNRIWTSIILLIATCGSALAQRMDRGMLRLRSADGTPLAVSIDGRRYDRTGRKLMIGDLPRGRHRLIVYAVYPNRYDGGGSGETVYRGVFYADPGTITECVVNADAGTARFRTVDMDYRYDDNSNRNPPRDDYNQSDRYQQDNRTSGFSSSDMEDLRRRVADRITDGDKVKTLQSALDRRTVRSSDVRTMLDLLSFDSSRLEFAKWAFTHVSDRSNYWKLEDAFSFDSTKTDFNNFIRSQS